MGKLSPLKSVDWSEFLKNESGKESADRLMLVLSYPIASYLALKIGTTEALGVYLAAYGALAANNKWAGRNAVVNDSQQLESDSDSYSDSDSRDTGVSTSSKKMRKRQAKRND